jgi:hypothetical protein
VLGRSPPAFFPRPPDRRAPTRQLTCFNRFPHAGPGIHSGSARVPAAVLALIEHSCYNGGMNLYPACCRPARNLPCPGNPTYGPRPPSAAGGRGAHAGRPVPARKITYNHREGSPTTIPAPTFALHLSVHSRQPAPQTCTTMPHSPVSRPYWPQLAPFAAEGTIRPPAPFSTFLQKKNPKNNHRHRGDQAVQSAIAPTPKSREIRENS